MPGKLIVIEGPDGTGKQTQAELLAEALSKKFRVAKMQFPCYSTPSGQKVRDYLDGKLGEFEKVDPIHAASLYYDDRKANMNKIQQLLQENDFVILDRWKYSNQIYQPARFTGAERDAMIETIRRMEADLPEGDLVIHLSIPAEVSQTLMDKQGRTKDLHEANIEVMRNQIHVYDQIAEHYIQQGFWVKHDCTRNGKLMSIPEIHAQVMEIMKQKFAEVD